MIVEVKGHIIEVFDDIKELGILRFQNMNKYNMKANEVGDNFQDYDARMLKALTFLESSMIDEAKQELSNQRLTVFNAYNNNIVNGKAFAVMVKSIDGYKYNTYESSDVEKVILHLEKIGLSHINSMEALNEVKKKIEKQLQVYFPESFSNYLELEQNTLKLKLINSSCDAIIHQGEAEKHEKEAAKLKKQLLETVKPNVWNVNIENNIEKTIEVDFKVYAFYVTDHLKLDLKNITVFDFYASVKYKKEKFKKK